MRAPLVVSLLAVAGLPWAAPARADVVLTTEDGFQYDLQDHSGLGTAGGEVRFGGRADSAERAFSTLFKLEVNGVRYITPSNGYGIELGGRQLVLGEVKIAGLYVNRHVFVPAAVGEYVRYVDVIRNPSNKAVAVTVTLSGRTAFVTTLRQSSSGDAAATAGDTWFSMDDDDATGEAFPSAVVMHDGEDPSLPPTAVSVAGSLLEWQFEFEIPPHGQRAVMTLGVQGATRPLVAAEAGRIQSLPADVLTGLGELRSDLVNFSPSGYPVVRGALPYTLPEGEAVTTVLDLRDPEDDPLNWSWDLDGNGVFNDGADTLTATLAAGTTDGDRTWRIGVRVTDGVLTTERQFSIRVTNVAPEIVSLPDTRPVSLDVEYVYDVDVEDPAMAKDPLVYTLVKAPDGATVDSEGRLTWTPTVADRGTTAEFQLDVTDGDGGLATQSWTLLVSDNRVPSPPEPIYPVNVEVYSATPTIRVANGVDADGDPLVYRFRLDRSPGFTSNDLLESADLKEQTNHDGETWWTVPVALDTGVWYWQVRADDGMAESEARGGRFVWAKGLGNIDLPDSGVPPLPIPDVGALEPTPECAVAAPGARTSPGGRFPYGVPVLVALALGARLRARDRRRRVEGGRRA